MFEKILQLALSVAIGAFIGFLTNKVALKLLFRPYRVKKIGKIRIPFTPGMIPKNKDRIAESIGRTIANELLTSDEIAKKLRDSGIKEKVEEKVISLVFKEDVKVEKIVSSFGIDIKEAVHKVSDSVTNIIIEEARKIDILGFVKKIIVDSVKDEPLLKMFVFLFQTDKIASIVEKKIHSFLEESAYNTLNNAIEPKVSNIFSSQVKNICEKFDIGENAISAAVDSLFDKSISYAKAGVEAIDIKGIVEDKLKAMDTRDVEKLINDIASRELRGIENLGWLLGGIIGIINALDLHTILTGLIS